MTDTPRADEPLIALISGSDQMTFEGFAALMEKHEHPVHIRSRDEGS